MADAEDRTEAPSARRLQQARDDGQIALSREAMNFIALMAGAIGTFALLPILLPTFVRNMQLLMMHAGSAPLSHNSLQQAAEQAFQSGLLIAVPVAGTVMAFGIGCGILQSGFLIHPESLLPKFERISPLAGLKRIFGGGTLPDTFKSIAKLLVFSVVVWNSAKKILPETYGMVGASPGNLMHIVSDVCLHAVVAMILAQLVIAGADILWTRFRHTSKLRMSRQEMKDEYRNTEGDPHVKGRLKALRAKAARQRMMDGVKDSTVVITNPTHYAVALAYEKGTAGAPKIVAKGMDDVAARIRELAQDNRIPVISNPPLARALFPLPLDSEVPAEHFKVVAAIIAYVWKLKQPAAPHTPIS